MSLGAHSKELSLQVPLMEHYRETQTLGFQSLFVHIFVESLLKELSRLKKKLTQDMGKQSHCPWSLMQMEGLHTVGCRLVP